MASWRTIGSCPRGAYVLLTGYWDGKRANDRWATVGWRDEDVFWEILPDGTRDELYRPTHWKPIGYKMSSGGNLDRKFVKPPQD